MKGIKDIIVKGSIFAVLSAIFCVGTLFHTPFTYTVLAATEWSEDHPFNETETINDDIKLTNDITLTVAEGVELTVNGRIFSSDGETKTLTVEGPGTVTVLAPDSSSDGYDGVKANVIMNGGTLTTKGGKGGSSSTGGSGIYGDVTMYGGTLEAVGGLSEIGGGGCGIRGSVSLNGGTLGAYGESGILNGGSGISSNGDDITVTLNGGTLTAIGGSSTGHYGGSGIEGAVILNSGILETTGGEGSSAGGDGIYGVVTLNGGTIKAIGGTGHNPGDAFDGDVTIAEGKSFTVDGTIFYTRTLSNDDKEAIAGKFLTSCPAVIGEDYYDTVRDAMDAANDRNNTIKLLKDMETDSTLTVSKNLILDLNGHTITMTEDGDVIKVQAGSGLTIKDSREGAGGGITHLESKTGRGVYVEGCDAPQTGGSFTMNGGSISGNTVADEKGGGVYVGSRGRFEMSAGIIYENTAASGGGVYVDEHGCFDMSGGSIYKNKADYLSNETQGGGVFVNKDGSFNMSGDAVIRDNTAVSGGGVFVNNKGHFTMTDGNIYGNETTVNNGGGVCIGMVMFNNPGFFTMTGGSISGNKAEGNGGGVCVSPGSSFTMKDKAVIKGNTAVYGGGGVYVSKIASFTLSGMAEISGNTANNVHLDDEVYITINGGLTGTGKVGINSFSAPCKVAEGGNGYIISEESRQYFFSDDPAYYADFDSEKKELQLSRCIGQDEITVEDLTYNGKDQDITVSHNGIILDPRDYTVVYSPYTPHDAGDYTAAISSYKIRGGKAEKSFKVLRAVYDGKKEASGTAKYGTSGTLDLQDYIVEGGNLTIKSVDDPDGVISKDATLDGTQLKWSFKEDTTGQSKKAAVLITVKSANYQDYDIQAELIPQSSQEEEEKKYEEKKEEEKKEEEQKEEEQKEEEKKEEEQKEEEQKEEEKKEEEQKEEEQKEEEKKEEEQKEEEKKEEEQREEETAPDKLEPEKMPQKVPVSDPASSYASPEDNFAPVAPGSSDGIGGSIKKLELDFSKVKESGVAPDSLKITAIAGSKFTTKEKVKGKDSVHADKGIKVKFNKKDGTVTITCKQTGSIAFDTENGDSYRVQFTVEKPKPNKNEGKIPIGTAPVTKTVKELFGTNISGGKLTILKEKLSGQATLKGNDLTVNPAEQNTIKLQYQYLNKKYKLSIKVK